MSAEDRLLASGASYQAALNYGGTWGDTNRGKSYKHSMVVYKKLKQCFSWTAFGKMVQAWSQSGPSLSTSDVNDGTDDEDALIEDFLLNRETCSFSKRATT